MAGILVFLLVFEALCLLTVLLVLGAARVSDKLSQALGIVLFMIHLGIHTVTWVAALGDGAGILVWVAHFVALWRIVHLAGRFRSRSWQQCAAALGLDLEVRGDGYSTDTVLAGKVRGFDVDVVEHEVADEVPGWTRITIDSRGRIPLTLQIRDGQKVPLLGLGDPAFERKLQPHGIAAESLAALGADTRRLLLRKTKRFSYCAAGALVAKLSTEPPERVASRVRELVELAESLCIDGAIETRLEHNAAHDPVAGVRARNREALEAFRSWERLASELGGGVRPAHEPVLTSTRPWSSPVWNIARLKGELRELSLTVTEQLDERGATFAVTIDSKGGIPSAMWLRMASAEAAGIADARLQEGIISFTVSSEERGELATRIGAAIDLARSMVESGPQFLAEQKRSRERWILALGARLEKVIVVAAERGHALERFLTYARFKLDSLNRAQLEHMELMLKTSEFDLGLLRPQIS